MAVAKVTDEEFIALWNKHGGMASRVAKALGMSLRPVYLRRRSIESRLGVTLTSIDVRGDAYAKAQGTAGELQARVQELEAALRTIRRETIDEQYVKSKIVKLANMDPKPPAWLIHAKAADGILGVPSVLWSDWHWGEVVDRTQLNGVNEFNMEIAHRRARHMVQSIVDLLTKWMVKPKYPGIVVNLGGDMISGDIHEELTATNEAEVMPVLLDLYGVLIECIEHLAAYFGHVFVPCVSGNHGRNTHKIRAKGRNFTSFDWLLYCFLAKHFERDKRVRFHIPNGPDALYQIYGHRYLLTHGDQFRGGDGMIGHIGPVKRGQRKKQSRNAELDQQFDTMLHGHFHTYSPGRRIIGNGSLVGYSEYSNQQNFEFEPPIQAMWLTHPTHGITYHIPLYLDAATSARPSGEWVSWMK